jgi:hypothetical protein
VVAADALVDLLQDVLAFLSGNALHENSGRCAPSVELVSNEDVELAWRMSCSTKFLSEGTFSSLR